MEIPRSPISCIHCGDLLPDVLARLGSPHCHTCRGAGRAALRTTAQARAKGIRRLAVLALHPHRRAAG